MSQQPQIFVYLQALGAHFLGQNAYKVQDIVINLVYSGGVKNFYYVFKNTNDGKPTTTFNPGTSSFMPIMTVPQLPGEQTSVTFLSRDEHTVCGRMNIELPASIELAHLEISVPTTDGVILLRYPVLLNPNQREYIVTVAIPGLYLSLPTIQKKDMISVYVKMMCGCPVAPYNPPHIWPPDDFTVRANVIDTSGGITPYTLTYDPSNELSLFSATLVQGYKPIKSVAFSAIQKSTGNYGAEVFQS
jgi:hypothetical protein